MVITTTNILLLFSLVIAAATTTNTTSAARNRRLLHQPFFPPSTALPPTHSPSLPPVRQRQPKSPFSATPNTKHKPFFPTFPSTPSPPPPPLPPPPSVSSLATFPANISSVLFPHPPSSSSSSSRHHLVTTISISLSIVFAATLAALSAFFLYSRRRSRHRTTTTSDKTPRSDSLRLFPPNAIHSDGSPKPPKLPHRPGVPNTSSEFLYLGTLGNSRNDLEDNQKATNATNAGITIGVSSPAYRKLGSPELRPLPPLPRHDYTPSYRSGEVLLGSSKEGEADPDTDEEEEQFFSPRGSSGRKGFLQESSPLAMGSSSRREFQGLQGENFGSRSFNSRTASYPHSNSVSPANSISTSPSVVSNSSRTSLKSKSSDIVMSNPARFESVGVANPFVQMGLWPPPPPPPPPQFREIPGRIAQDSNWVSPGPPRLVTLSKKPVLVRNGVCEENPKPKLKPFNWDKVRGRSDRDMVWDQLKSNAFQLNEGMIETVFMVKNPNLIMKDNNGRRQSFPLLNRENQVLDPKKSKKIAILLRALNVTVDEVCEALLEGNSDMVGTELLESLLKMTPNEEEEQKLKEFKDDSPIKLGTAEKFLKAVLDIPFAFKRVDAMLYIANFESEVDYLERSFKTIEGACEELRNSRMFQKLVEAVHRTGNSMNVGTNCSDANAFKLDTLDKLINVKGTDGKTTLLHFVVQEIARYEGSRLSSTNQNNTVERNKQLDFQHDVEIVNLGLQVVSGLSGELTNVKNAAVMDSNVLSNEVEKLSSGITKVREVLKLNEEKESSWKFSESMNGFLSKAGEELGRIRAQEQVVLSKVKELAEYFHGNSVKEEAHSLRIFMVVRDFLSILDQVCKEAGKVNERTFYSSIHPALTNPTLLPIFPGLDGRPHYGSSDDEGSSWS